MLPGHKAIIAFERYKNLRDRFFGANTSFKSNLAEYLVKQLGLECLSFLLNDLYITPPESLFSRDLKTILWFMYNEKLIPYNPNESETSLNQIKQWAIEEGYYDE